MYASERTAFVSHQATLIQALGRIGNILNHVRLSEPDSSQPLKILGNCLSLNASAFFLILTKEDSSFELQRVGHWEMENRPASLILDSKSIPDAVFSVLRKGEITFFKESSLGQELLLLPVNMCDQLSGIIAIEGLTRGHFNSEIEIFLQGIISLFELWINTSNETKKFDDLVEFLPNPVMGLDANGVVTIWNRATVQMTGWKASRILGKGDYEIALPFYGVRRPTVPNLVLHPDPHWEATYKEYRDEGDVVHTLSLLPVLTGGETLVKSATKRMRDINGRIYGSLHLVRDVTRERKIESRLQSSESMFKTITDYAGLGIALFRSNKTLYYNERFVDLIGVSKRTITLRDVFDSIHPEDREEIYGRIAAMIDGNEKGPLRLELRVQVREKDRFYSSYAEMLDYEGLPALFFVLDDTTDQKELTQRVRANELKMYHEGRLTSLGIMAAGIAHELNQPLNTIRVITDGILFGRDEGWTFEPEEVYESMEMVSKQVLRMAGVIQNIRNFSREDSEKAFVNVDINQAINNVLSMIGRQFEVHGILLQKNLSCGLPAINGNLNRLEQVIMNLLVNARQAFDAWSRPEKRIWVRTGLKNKRVCLEVADNASGIPEDIMDKLFDPFFTTKEVGQGTGLGLTISRSIVKEFNGEIAAFNNKQGGATFRVALPAQGGSR